MKDRGSSTNSAGLDVRIMEDLGSSTNSAGVEVRIMKKEDHLLTEWYGCEDHGIIRIIY